MERYGRRQFLGRAAVGLGALGLGWPAPARARAEGAEPPAAPAEGTAAAPGPELIPTRPFGRSKVPVSCLSLGTMFDTVGGQLVLRRAVDLGVRHWDTADCYEGGASEVGIGNFFRRFPADREKVFLVTKADDYAPQDLRALLERSLARLRTSYVDLYLLHALSDPDDLTPAVRRFAEEEKKKGRIRQFGFSAHRNVPALLTAAAKHPWLDGALVSYNHEERRDPEMDAAVQAAHEAGIGLASMKVLRADIDRDEPIDQRDVLPHLAAGFSPDQARVRAVLADPRIATVCLTMRNVKLLETFVAAALGRPSLR